MTALRFCPHSEKALSQLIEQFEKRIGESPRPLLIGIGGPGGCGKSTLTQKLSQDLPESIVLSLDDFRLPRKQRPAHAPFGSHPEAVDRPRLFATLERARSGNSFSQPHFDRSEGRVLNESILPAAKVIFIDGELTAYSELHPYLDYLILVQTSLWNQWITRLKRDRTQRQCSLLKTLRIFIHSNLKDHPRFSRQAKARADLIFYRNRNSMYSLTKSQPEGGGMIHCPEKGTVRISSPGGKSRSI